MPSPILIAGRVTILINFPAECGKGSMIAMAIVNRPKLLIADEPTTALDVTIQAQILDLLSELRARFGLAMLFISHDLAVVSQVADRVAVLYAGNLVELGTKEEIFRYPSHPYTRGLLNSAPTLATDRTHPLGNNRRHRAAAARIAYRVLVRTTLQLPHPRVPRRASAVG